MKSFIRKTSKPITLIIFLVALISSLFVFQVNPTKAEDPHAEMVWVLTETQVNPNDAQLEFYGGGTTPGYFGEARFEGTFLKYAVTETSFRIDDRFVDYEYEYHNVTIETYFEKPPLKLTPGETIELIYGFSHSGTAEDIGTIVRFWYDSEDVDIQPDIVFTYAPWADNFDGTADGTYSFKVPPASNGGEIEIYASWWNAEPCLVIWKYQAQEVSGTADEKLAPDPDEEPPVDQDDETTSPGETIASTDGDLPDWVKNGEAYISWSGQAVYVPEWLGWIKPKKVIKARGVLIEAGLGKDVWVYSRAFNKWLGPVQSDWELYTGDIVSTGPDTLVRVVFTNADGKQDTISVGSRTLLEIPEVAGSGDKSDYPTLWTLYGGAIKIKHAILGGTSVQLDHPRAFVRTPNTVVGVRGTEFVVNHDPETQTSSIYLISGELDYYNLAAAGPDDAILSAGKKLVVTGDGTETILPLDEAELEPIMASSNLDEAENLDQEEIEQFISEELDAENQAASKNNNLKLVIFGAIMCVLIVFGIGAVVVFFVFLSKRRAV